MNRFKETRRRHPLAERRGGLAEGIAAEREALAAGARAGRPHHRHLATCAPQQLRALIRERFTPEERKGPLVVTVSSFGFKYGLPIDADIVMDVRFLPNPYYIAELRDHTGQNAAVRDFVLGRAETQEFLERVVRAARRAACPATWPRARRICRSRWAAPAACIAASCSPSETADYLRALGYQVSRAAIATSGKDRERR